MTLNYQQQLTQEDFDRVRLSPHMVWVRDSKKLPTRTERAFHLNKFWQYLKDTHEMNSEDLKLEIFHKQLVPEYNKRGAKCSGVCFGFQEDNAALVRIGTAKESLYTSLVVLAHEFRHAFQLLKQQRWGGDEVELECDAISFGYEVATIYCEKTFVLGEI